LFNWSIQINKLLMSALILTSISARSEIVGKLFINPEKTEAHLVINETNQDGDLSKFFEQIKLPSSGSGRRQTKAFAMKNGLFGFKCNQGDGAASCTFFIKKGQNTSDLNTFVSKVGNEKVAAISMTKNHSEELGGLFPENSNRSISFVLNPKENVHLNVDGAIGGLLSIGFSEN
jgi:hypothetical protein